MLGILSAVVGLLVLLWMFYDFFWPPPPLADRQLGKPDRPVEYNLKHTFADIPRLAGKKLIFSKWLARTGLGDVLKRLAIRKGEMDLFHKIRIPDAPTLFPLPPSSPETKTHRKVDLEELIENRFVIVIDMIVAGKNTTMAFKFQSAHVIEMCSHKKKPFI